MNIQIRVLATQAQQRLAQLNQQIGALNGSWSSAASGVDKFGRAVGGLRLDALGSRVQWIGRQLEYNFTLPIVAAGAAASKFALDNEAAFTRVTKVYGDATHGAQFYANELQSLQRAFEALSSTFGVTQKDTINIAADWAAAGASGVALAKSVKLTMETMILGELNATDATKALIAIQAQYGYSTDKLVETISILNMVENQTGISLSGLIDGFARAAGVARSAGVDVRHLAALLAALTPAAGSASQAGNALKTIFSRLLSPTEETSQVLGLMGINVKDLSWQSSNLVDRLTTLSTKFETLSDSQKNVVSSVVASRWQINKFDILMRELSSDTGYYKRALDSTSDAQANFTQMQSELNTVLSSNPQRLKIIWTILQNALSQVIQPMIPALLYIAQVIANAVKWFSNLSPSVQKLVIVMLGLLAVIGPLIRYIGATLILVAEIGKFFGLLARPIVFVTGVMWKLMAVPIALFFRGAALAAAGFARIVGPILTVAMIGVRNLFLIALPAIVTIFKAGMFALQTATVWFATFTKSAWLALATGIGTVAGAIWYRVVIPIWTAGLAALRTVVLTGVTAIGMIWRGALWAMAMVTSRIFWVTILGTVTNFLRAGLLPALRTAGTAIVAAMTGPWGIAIAAIIAVVIVFWKQIRGAFTGIVNSIKAGWNALPVAIRGAIMNVVRVIAAGVARARELLSYLNPWARHSPSLVDNVTTGVAEIVRQFSLLRNVNTIFDRAGVSVHDFSESLYKARQMADALQWKKVASDIAEFAPALTGDFNNLMSVLTSLRKEMSDLSSTFPIEQAKALSDAIFNNDQATKSLQLQMMHMEDAVGPLDKLKSRLDSINGALEMAGGEKAALRNAGAGSEILSQYDDQITALNDQKSAIESQIKPIQDMADQINALQRAGDELNLEQSLALDPITRQMDELNGAINTVEDSLNAMSQAAQAASDATGRLTPGAQNFLDAVGGDFPDVGGFAQIGREGGIQDQAALIDQFTQDLADQTKNMFGLFDFLDPIKNAWNTAMGWLKQNVGPSVSAFWNTLTSSFKGLGNPFGGLNIGGVFDTLMGLGKSLIQFFKDIWTVIGPAIKQVGDVLKQAWGQALDKIGPQLAKFKDLVQPLGQLFSELWTILKPIVILVGGALVLAFSILANVFANIIGPIINWIIDVISGVIQILRGLLEFLVGVFTGNWELAWKGIKDFFGGIWNIIYSTVKNALLLIWGIIQGVFEGIWEFMKLIWSKIGDSITGAWNNTINWIKNTWNSFIGWIQGTWNTFTNIFSWNNIIAGFKGFINTIIGYWNKLDFGIHFGFTIPGWVPGIGGQHFGVDINDIIPDIGYLAKGGFLTNGAAAIVGEGRSQYPEYVIPTDPAYRKRSLMLFAALSQNLGVKDLLAMSFFSKGRSDGSGVAPKPIQYLARGGVLGSRTFTGDGIMLVNETKFHTFNNYGDLNFPNIKSGADAEEFLRNLEALMDEA
jgi:TP901 family phage tail tape measure protein